MSEQNQSSSAETDSVCSDQAHEDLQLQAVNFPLVILSIKESLFLLNAIIRQQVPAKWQLQQTIIKLQKSRSLVLKAMATSPRPTGIQRGLVKRLKAQIQTQRKSNEQRMSSLRNQNISLLQKINTINEQLSTLKTASFQENSLLQQKQFLLDRRLEESSVMLNQIQQQKTQLISLCDKLKYSDAISDRIIAEVLGSNLQQRSQEIIRSSLRLARAVAKLGGKQGSFKSKLHQGWRTIKIFMKACRSDPI